jgi:hypothetical protein
MGGSTDESDSWEQVETNNPATELLGVTLPEVLQCFRALRTNCTRIFYLYELTSESSRMCSPQFIHTAPIFTYAGRRTKRN